ncbi:nucleotidyltransferase family protein, partial [Candidatus Frankia nodulisporulans]|uniref:nucleotidyltransferase family protein n=1 Tax=Candidatus Frankia nodulisporulans TaxID=2060052 RepID=UPI003703FDEF
MLRLTAGPWSARGTRDAAGRRAGTRVRRCRRRAVVACHGGDNGRVTVDLGDSRIAEVCRRYGVAELSVFGSVARGDDTASSDIDLLYVLAPDSTLGFDLVDLRDELAKIVGRRVDLVPKSRLKGSGCATPTGCRDQLPRLIGKVTGTGLPPGPERASAHSTRQSLNSSHSALSDPLGRAHAARRGRFARRQGGHRDEGDTERLMQNSWNRNRVPGSRRMLWGRSRGGAGGRCVP